MSHKMQIQYLHTTENTTQQAPTLKVRHENWHYLISPHINDAQKERI